MPPPCSPCPRWELGPVPEGCPAPSGLRQGTEVGDTLTVLIRAAGITLGWEL